MRNIIFLDVDGVLNCQLYYKSMQFESYKEAKKQLKKDVKAERIERMDYYASQICRERVSWLSKLCKDTDTQVVVSSTWRSGKSIEELQEIFNNSGATFTVLDKTCYCECRTRGCEIDAWLKANCLKHFGVHSHDFYRYAIIDDDSDMLLNQANHFFQTDNWSGLTPNTCYRVKRFFTHEAF